MFSSVPSHKHMLRFAYSNEAVAQIDVTVMMMVLNEWQRLDLFFFGFGVTWNYLSPFRKISDVKMNVVGEQIVT